MLRSPKAEHASKGKGCLLSPSPPTAAMCCAVHILVYYILPYPSLKVATRMSHPPRP